MSEFLMGYFAFVYIYIYIFVQDAYRLYSFVEITQLSLVLSVFFYVCFLKIAFEKNEATPELNQKDTADTAFSGDTKWKGVIISAP